jgi:hypothetical protein
MVRELTIGIRVDEKEKEELQKRADNAHLKLSSYARWFLFSSEIMFTERPIERVRNGIPKRLVSKQITNAVMQTNKGKEVIAEMKAIFEEGLQLVKLNKKELEKQLELNRKVGPIKSLAELKLKPPPLSIL